MATFAAVGKRRFKEDTERHYQVDLGAFPRRWSADDARMPQLLVPMPDVIVEQLLTRINNNPSCLFEITYPLPLLSKFLKMKGVR